LLFSSFGSFALFCLSLDKIYCHHRSSAARKRGKDLSPPYNKRVLITKNQEEIYDLNARDELGIRWVFFSVMYFHRILTFLLVAHFQTQTGTSMRSSHLFFVLLLFPPGP
jgi:hypothetical protein